MKRLKRFAYALKFYLYNAAITQIPSYDLRRWYLVKVLGYELHSTTSVHIGCFFTGSKLKVGANSVINRNCYLDCRTDLIIGSNVSISPECYLMTAGHDPQSPLFSGKNRAVFINDYAWLGARVIILPGVTMGAGAVAAAGSIVTKSVDEFSIVGGNPARFIKSRNRNLSYKLDWFPFFNTDVY